MNSSNVEESGVVERDPMGEVSQYFAGERAAETSRGSAPCPCKHGPIDDGLSAFVNVRPRLFGIAYECSVTSPRRRTSCKMFGFAGRPPIVSSSEFRSVSGHRHDAVGDQSCQVRPLAARSVRGNLAAGNRSTPASTTRWAQNAARL